MLCWQASIHAVSRAVLPMDARRRDARQHTAGSKDAPPPPVHPGVTRRDRRMGHESWGSGDVARSGDDCIAISIRYIWRCNANRIHRPSSRAARAAYRTGGLVDGFNSQPASSMTMTLSVARRNPASRAPGGGKRPSSRPGQASSLRSLSRGLDDASPPPPPLDNNVIYPSLHDDK